MHIMEFNGRYQQAKRDLIASEGAGLEAAQAELRALVPQIASAEDRAVADRMIDSLPRQIIPPPPPGPLYVEALEIEREAFAFRGPDAERIAILAEARRRIWELADRAPAEESPNIRALSRPLEHIEDSLLDPAWDFDKPVDGREG